MDFSGEETFESEQLEWDLKIKQWCIIVFSIVANRRIQKMGRSLNFDRPILSYTSVAGVGAPFFSSEKGRTFLLEEAQSSWNFFNLINLNQKFQKASSTAWKAVLKQIQNLTVCLSKIYFLNLSHLPFAKNLQTFAVLVSGRTDFLQASFSHNNLCSRNVVIFRLFFNQLKNSYIFFFQKHIQRKSRNVSATSSNCLPSTLVRSGFWLFLNHLTPAVKNGQ